jgi:hypothetical protein
VAAVRSSSRQHLNTDPDMSISSTTASWYQQCSGLVVLGPARAPLHRSASCVVPSGVDSNETPCDDAYIAEHDLWTVLETVLDSTTAALQTELAIDSDAGRPCVVDWDDRDNVAFFTSCWVPVNGYSLDSVGMLHKTISAAPPLFAARFHEACAADEEDAGGAADGVDVRMRNVQHGIFLFGVAARYQSRDCIDDSATSTTFLLGWNAARYRDPSPVDGVESFRVPYNARLTSVCTLWAIGGVLGSTIAPGSGPHDVHTLTSVGVVHPALVCLKPSWLR